MLQLNRNFAGLCLVIAIAQPVWAAEDAGRTQPELEGKKGPRQIASLSTSPVVSPPPQSAINSRGGTPKSKKDKTTPVDKKATRSSNVVAPSTQPQRWLAPGALPVDVEEAVDACVVVGKRSAIVAKHKFDELMRWLAPFYKQMHDSVIATPAGAPYIRQPLITQVRPTLFLTPEGRLKTVADR